MKCLFRLDGPASESPSRWRSCDHCRRSRDSGRRRRLALLGGSRVRAMSSVEHGIQLVWFRPIAL